MPAPIMAEVVARLSTEFRDTSFVASEGDVFLFAGGETDFPFATVVAKDTDFDNLSKLNRDGVFRLNIGVGKETFLKLFPQDGALQSNQLDFSVIDRVMPHPMYGRMYWLCVLNPSWERMEELKEFLQEAHDLQLSRTIRRRSAGRQA